MSEDITGLEQPDDCPKTSLVLETIDSTVKGSIEGVTITILGLVTWSVWRDKRSL